MKSGFTYRIQYHKALSGLPDTVRLAAYDALFDHALRDLDLSEIDPLLAALVSVLVSTEENDTILEEMLGVC